MGLALSVRDLAVAFPGLERLALAIPELVIARGEKVAVSGPSGCGKTTFLNIAAGLERARRGQVRWDGDDLAALSESARDRWRRQHVGLVMQEFHLFAGLSALDNALLPVRLSHLRLPAGAKAEALRLLARVGIERSGQPVETMSRGQMQRVALARALVGRPQVIIADEPTASLDGEAGTAVADLLLELAGEADATLLVATHDRHLAARLDRLLSLDAGVLANPAGDGRRLAGLPFAGAPA